MHRQALEYLSYWQNKVNRKPLVIRGARQVGKSYLVRELARSAFDNLIEVNFESDPELAGLFSSRAPDRIIQLLELRFGRPIEPGKTLLFLDEIQAAASVIPVLRFFHEQRPELHVIAAGSLLEFALAELPYSMPVGRIEYLYLGPMQFEEFLLAAGQERLVKLLAGFHQGDEMAGAIHERLMSLLRTYLIIGGMPEAVAAYLRQGSFREAEEVKSSIHSTYRQDFGKYARRVPHARLHTVFNRLPSLVGSRLKYVSIDRAEPARALGQALDLLCMARVAHRVRHSSANGVPLGAEAKDAVFKVLFLDVGLVSTAHGLSLLDFEPAADLLLANAGAVCEQLVGQHLLYSQPPYQEPDLFFWMREKAGSSAEVDYLIAEGLHVLPVEVKAGKTGTLKSLHSFLKEKRRSFGLRFNGDLPSLLDADTALADGGNVHFRLLSLPLYLVGQTRRLVRELLGRGAELA